MRVVVDGLTRACLAIDIVRTLKSDDVLERIGRLMATRLGVPGNIRSDNGPEYAAKAVQDSLGKVGVETLFIKPGAPWKNGRVESLNGKLRDELLDRDVFETVLEARATDRRRRLCRITHGRPGWITAATSGKRTEGAARERGVVGERTGRDARIASDTGVVTGKRRPRLAGHRVERW